MPSFGTTSKARLSTCHPDLQRLCEEVVKVIDCTITEGHRGEIRQNELYPKFSKVQWPNSWHNQNPSLAVDLAPYDAKRRGIPWPDRDAPDYAVQLGRWYLFAGYVKATAERLGINIRMGADWDGDADPTDQGFHDLPHIELVRG